MTANTQVESIVREIAEPWRAELERQFNTHYVGVVNSYTADCLLKPEACGDPHYLYPTSGNMGKSEYRRQTAKQGRIAALHVLESTPRPHEEWIGKSGRVPQHRSALVADWRNIVARRATKDADESVAGFVFKITAKLTGIVDACGGAKSVQTTGYLNDNEINFVLNNGTSFAVKNAIVWHCNEYGTVYCQYPTTFHAVVINGESVKVPSEAKLKKLLGVPEEVDPTVCPGTHKELVKCDERGIYGRCAGCTKTFRRHTFGGRLVWRAPKHKAVEVAVKA